MPSRFSFIRTLRTKKHLTIEQLAERADVSIDLIARLERGDRNDVSVSNLEKILHALGLKIGDVFERSNLDTSSEAFIKEFLEMDAESQKQYADLFLTIINMNKHSK